MSTTIIEIDIDQTNELLAPMSAQERILWAVEQFGASAVLLSSMQKTASVLMHIFYALGLSNDVVFGDTGFHFHETLKMRDEFMRRYRINLVTVYPALTPEQQEKRYGRKLYQFEDGQPECCRLRKEEPFITYMRENERRLAMIGARRVDGGRRSNLKPMAVDPRIDGYGFHPILDWSDDMVAEYIKVNNIPTHPLHGQDYPSIGCECCTTPVGPGENARAGRWRHLRQPDQEGPIYCGLNFTDGSGI